MHFLFKPSMSYAMFASMSIMSALALHGYWTAAIIYLVVSSIIGGITEAIVMERAA